MEEKEYLDKYEQSLTMELLKVCTQQGRLAGQLLPSPDLDEKWEQVAQPYMGDAIKEIAKYPTVALGWMMYVGMAVGVILASAMAEGAAIPMSAAWALAIGIAIQNFPEGAILSMPLHSEGMSKGKSFLIGALSGIVEPIASILTILLIGFISPALPYLLAFAAGAMMYVVVEELIPEAQAEPHSNIPTLGFTVGFVLMMILDSAL
jgi:hypothetical protein